MHFQEQREAKVSNVESNRSSRDEKHHRRRRRRPHHQSKPTSTSTSSPIDQNTKSESIVFRQSEEEKLENRRAINKSFVTSMVQSETRKTSIRNRSDSDGESEPLPIKPWSPAPTAPIKTVTAQPTQERDDVEESQRSSSPQSSIAFRAVFEMITEDLDKFVYTPAPNGLGDIQCRITRDKRGMEKGLFPTYYMHVERPSDGRKVSTIEK